VRETERERERKKERERRKGKKQYHSTCSSSIPATFGSRCFFPAALSSRCARGEDDDRWFVLRLFLLLARMRNDTKKKNSRRFLPQKRGRRGGIFLGQIMLREKRTTTTT
jgi:hypothetical protein